MMLSIVPFVSRQCCTMKKQTKDSSQIYSLSNSNHGEITGTLCSQFPHLAPKL